MNQSLTSVAAFKRWYNLPTTNVLDDQLLQELIDDASLTLISYLDRPTLVKNTYSEYYDGAGGPQIVLRQWPVTSVTSVYDTGQALAAAVQPNFGYFLDPWNGFLPGKMQTLNYIGGSTAGGNYLYGGGYFSQGFKNIFVTYTAGYGVTGESGTIPASGPYQVVAAQNQGMWAQDDGVTIDGVTATATTAAPAQGQYNVQAGTYTFNAADTGLAVVLNYSYIPYTIVQACNMMVGEMYGYRQHIGQKTHTVQGNVATSFDNSIMTDAIKKKVQPFRRMVPW